MSYQFELDSTHGILRCGLEGHVTDTVMREYYCVLAEHYAHFCPPKVVYDFSGVTSFEISVPVVRELAGRAPVRPDPNRLRVVVAPSYNMTCVARMFQTESRPNMHIVRGLREAWALMGVRKPRFAPLPSRSADGSRLADLPQKPGETNGVQAAAMATTVAVRSAVTQDPSGEDVFEAARRRFFGETTQP